MQIEFVNSLDWEKICNDCIYFDSEVVRACSGAMFVVNGDNGIACLTKIEKDDDNE